MGDNLVGIQLGQYQLTELIRQGGMALVYRAYQPSLDRYVAVKVLARSTDVQFVQRFKREAHAIAQLQHPNILPVFDYGEQEGILYLVTQYIENGVTLADKLGAPMEVVQALQLTVRVLSALEYAHSKGIVHRDIKPANILMPSPTWPMLADFGVAKLLNPEAGKTITEQGMVVGTAAYMAPEQAFGLPVDARTDLYSTGVVLYELVTGRVPFDGNTPMGVVTKHAYEPPPPPRTINPNLSPEVEAALLRSLAKDRAERYQSASEMSQELEGLIALLDHPKPENHLAKLYQTGVLAFEEGRWELAVERLTRVASVDPEYEDVADLLAAAQEALDNAKTEARQRLEMMQQRRQSTASQQAVVPPPAAPGQGAPPLTPDNRAARGFAPQAQQFQGPAAASAAPAPVPAEAAPAGAAGRTGRRGVGVLAPVGLVLLLIALAVGAALYAPSFLSRQQTPVQGAGASASGSVGGAGGSPQASPQGGASTTGQQEYGFIRFHDQASTFDAVTVVASNMPAPPAGKQYEVWLLGATNEQRQSLGVLHLDAGGNSELAFADPSGKNLLTTYDSFEITVEPNPDSSPLPEANVIYRGTLPQQALMHVGHLLVAFDSTPGQTALVTGLLKQATVLNGYAQAMLAAQQSGDLAKVKADAEAMVNLIEGAHGTDFGDLDGDGAVGGRVDEQFGLLLNGSNIGYIEGVIEHAQNAARAPDATENIKIHAAHTIIATRNVADWTVQVRDLCLAVVKGKTVEAVSNDVQQASSLANRLLNGVDLNHNETVDPVPGEGGARTAYQHAQYMADMYIEGGAPATGNTPTAPASSLPLTDSMPSMSHESPQPAPGTPAPAATSGGKPAPSGTGGSPQYPALASPSPSAATRASVNAHPPLTATSTRVSPSATPTSVPPTLTLTATPAPTSPPVAAPAGRLVLQDDFSSGPDKSGLVDEGKGTASTLGFHPPGVYHFKIAVPDQTLHAVLPRLAFSNFTMEIDLWDNSDNYVGSMAYGVVFRARDNDHFYAVLINPRLGTYTVRNYKSVTQWADLIPWTASTLIKSKAQVNHLRVDGDGANFKLALNGQPLANFADGSYPFGMLGLIAMNQDANLPHSHYDNLKVWSRDPAPAATPAPARVRESPSGAMVLVPGGEFIMGSNDMPDQPAHIVPVDAFYIDRTEVTNAAYQQCVQAGKCTPQHAAGSESHPAYAGQAQFAAFPAIHVSWQQARDYCAWAGKRLPTEAEWEKAASWNPNTREKVIWPFGNAFDPARLNSLESGIGDTSQVGHFPAELNNTFDMGGNVWEWTSSLFKPYPYVRSDGREDPQNPGDRVFRGGSWAQTQGKARAALRQSASPDYSDREIGFRCAANP